MIEGDSESERESERDTKSEGDNSYNFAELCLQNVYILR